MQRKGFTLLELIIVIVILGILASFAMPRYFRATERARAAEGISLLGTLRSSQIRYKAAKGVYSGDCTVLDVDYSTPKYFGAAACTAAGNETTDIVTFTRDTALAANPFGIAPGEAYVLHITGDGTVTCTAGPAGSCSGIGY